MTNQSNILPQLPRSWSGLTWDQLCKTWAAKQRYGSNNDVAIVAAMLALYGLQVEGGPTVNDDTGESVYRLKDAGGRVITTTPRQLAYYSRRQLPWFIYPYGDPGEPAVKDEKGQVTKEAREPHRGYVNENVAEWRDAMELPEETVTIDGYTFALPAVACENLTWHQYRALQSIAPQLFRDGISDEEALQMQAKFMAYITVPAEVSTNKDPFSPLNNFRYVAERAEGTVAFWQRQLQQGSPLFHICFQVWQTATANYYPSVFPLLFSQSTSRTDPLHTALTGEVSTINAIMKWQGYGNPQQVYDTNLPIILGVLNNMTKEAKEIEKMNRQIKNKKH